MTLTVEYLKDGQAAAFVAFAERGHHGAIHGLWIHILSRYFTLADWFLPHVDQRLPNDTRPDITLIKLPPDGVGRQSTVIVVEIKPAQANDTWDVTLSQAYHYAKSLKKKVKPTIGIAVKGRRFMPFKVKGSQIDISYELISLGVNNDNTRPPRGGPYDVIDNSDALQALLINVKDAALAGEYVDI